MRFNPLEGQLERLARTLTEQYGVNVECRGDNGWTDGKRIVLPSLPQPMDPALERMVVGYLDHEMGHVAFSDFSMVGEFAAKYPGREGLLNVVEDARIERCLMERWPGVRANLDAMFAQVRDRVISLIRQRDAFGRFCTAVYLKMSHHRDMLGLDSCVRGFEPLLAELPRLRNTRDAAELAERILQRWLTEHPPQKTPDGDRSEPDGEAGESEADGPPAWTRRPVQSAQTMA